MPSTELKDRFDKWSCYRRISSLRQYILVAQDRVYIDLYNRIGQTDTWENSFIDKPDDTLRIAGFDLSVPDIYLNVKFN